LLPLWPQTEPVYSGYNAWLHKENHPAVIAKKFRHAEGLDNPKVHKKKVTDFGYPRAWHVDSENIKLKIGPRAGAYSTNFFQNVI
jgi:hypothetical protein